MVHYTVPNKNRLQSNSGSRVGEANSPLLDKNKPKTSLFILSCALYLSGRVGWTVEAWEIVDTPAETKRVSSLLHFLCFSVVPIKF